MSSASKNIAATQLSGEKRPRQQDRNGDERRSDKDIIRATANVFAMWVKSHAATVAGNRLIANPRGTPWRHCLSNAKLASSL
jgi:hypothetical protein